MSSVVYFLRFERGIKIGTTTNFVQRMSSLRKEHGAFEVLGLVDGSYNVEGELHARFWEHRLSPNSSYRQEWFAPVDEVLSYIEQHKMPPESEALHRRVVRTRSHNHNKLDVRLPAEMHRLVVEEARLLGVTPSEVVRRALKMYFESRGIDVSMTVKRGRQRREPAQQSA